MSDRNYESSRASLWIWNELKASSNSVHVCSIPWFDNGILFLDGNDKLFWDDELADGKLSLRYPQHWFTIATCSFTVMWCPFFLLISEISQFSTIISDINDITMTPNSTAGSSIDFFTQRSHLFWSLSTAHRTRNFESFVQNLRLKNKLNRNSYDKWMNIIISCRQKIDAERIDWKQLNSVFGANLYEQNLY